VRKLEWFEAIYVTSSQRYGIYHRTEVIILKLQVTPQAARWFIDEMGLESGEAIRFYIQLYGTSGTKHHNFSLGIMRDEPSPDVTVRTDVDGITFFFTEGDKWFLEDYSMTVTVDDGEVHYVFDQA